MSGSAYLNDPSLGDELARHLAAAVDAAGLVPGALAWDGQAGSLVGCLMRSADLALWEGRYGLPRWLAVLADELAAELPSTQAAAGFGARLLDAIRPGTDLHPVASVVVLALLDDVRGEQGESTPELDTLLATIRALHQRVVAGDPPAPQEWRAVRKEASRIDAGFQEQDLAPALSEFAQAAAWDPTRSGSSVFEAVRIWKNVMRARAERRCGWTDAISAAIQQRLNQIFEVDMGGVQGETVTVFDILKEKYPEDHQLLLSKNDIDIQANAELNDTVIELLLNAIREAR